MAEEEGTPPAAEEKPAEGAAPAGEGGEEKKKSKKTLIIIIVVVVLLIGGAVGALFMMGIIGGGGEHHEEKKEEPHKIDDHIEEQLDNNKLVYYNLEEFLVNLKKVRGRPSFLKIAVTLEIVGEENLAKVKEKMPLIRDSFQVYLRELRSDDLQGSSGIFRLKEELILRINKVMYPVRISDIHIRDMLVQ